MSISPSYLAGLGGFLLSVIFRYTPKLNVWFEKQDNEVKQLIMGLMIILAAILTYSVSCQSHLQLSFIALVECNDNTVNALWGNVIMALVMNQGGHLILPKLGVVKVMAETQLSK